MDIRIDQDMLIIFGRPFLATIGAVIDVRNDTLTMKIRDKKFVHGLLNSGPISKIITQTLGNIDNSADNEIITKEGSDISNDIIYPNILRLLTEPIKLKFDPPIKPTGWR